MLYENSDEPYCEELAKAITDEIRSDFAGSIVIHMVGGISALGGAIIL